MKITVIGYWGAYPAANEATSAYLIEESGKNVLIDCGCGVISKLQNYCKLEDLDSIVLSHYHADHFGDIYCMQYAIMILKHMGARKKELNIYGIRNDPKFETLNYGNICIAHPIEESQKYNIDGLNFTFMKTNHPVSCLAMRIEKEGKAITYTADTGWSNNMINFANKSDLLICECNLYNYQKGAITGHLTAGEAGNLAFRSKVNQLILTHLPQSGDHNQLIKESGEYFKGNIKLACEGLKIEI